MWIKKVVIQDMGTKIGKVQEVEIDELGECIRSFAHVRILIGIKQPLKKVLMLELEDGEKIPIPILYEKLPEFCFCCGLIRHQYRVCLNYNGLAKEQLVFRAWMKVLTRVERTRQNKK